SSIRALPLFVLLEGGDEGQSAAPLLRSDPRGFGGRHGTRGAGTARAPRRLLFLGLQRGAGPGQPRTLRLFLAEPLLGFLLGLALGFLFVSPAVLLLALARFGGFALQFLTAFAVGPATRFLFGDAPFLGLAHARVGERVRARIALFVGERAEHDARRPGRRSRPPPCARDRGRACNGGFCLARGDALRRARRLGGLAFARRGDTALHLLDHHGLASAMAEALTHHALLDAAFERERLGRTDAQGLFARVF